MPERPALPARPSFTPTWGTQFSLTGRPLSSAACRPACTAANSSRAVILEHLRVGVVQTDVHAVQPGFQQGGQLLCQQARVGGQGNLPDAGESLEPRDQLRHALAHQRLAAGHLHGVNAAPGKQRGNAQEFFVGQDLLPSAVNPRRPAYSSGSAGCTGRSRTGAGSGSCGPWNDQT